MKAAILRGEPEVVAAGPRGSAKTLSIADMLLRFAMEYPGMTQRWGRLDRTRMSETVLKTFETEVLPAYPTITFKGPDRASREGYEFPNGSTIILHGIRDIEAMKSMQADVWWPNEASELPEGHWEDLGATARAQRYSTCPFRVKITDINPMPPAHWTNQRCPPVPESLYPRVLDDGTQMGKWMNLERYANVCAYNRGIFDFTKHKARKILFFHPENPGYWDYFNWQWTAKGLEYVQKQLGRFTGSRRARYLEGRPSAEEGIVFDEFERDTHVIHVGADGLFPKGWPKDWPVWEAYDPGYRHPCAVLFIGISPSNQPYVIDEIWGPKINIERLGPMIQEKEKKYRIVARLADPKGANQATQISNGETAMSYMRNKFGLHYSPWKGKMGRVVQEQVDMARIWLVRQPCLQVFDTCEGFIENIESWQNKDTKDGELIEGDDRYEDRNNDTLDAWIGIVMENPRFEVSASGIFRGQQ